MIAACRRTRGGMVRVMRRRAGLVAVLALVLAPATASAGWSQPETVSAPGRDASGPVVATNGRGDAVAAWFEQEPFTNQMLFFSERPAGGAWTAPQRLTAVDDYVADPAVAIAEDGAIDLVFRRDTRDASLVVARHKAAGSPTFGPLVQLGTQDGSGAADTTLRATEDGGLVAVWRSAMQPFGFARRPAGGAWGPAELIRSDTPPSAHSLAVGADGEVLASWIEEGLKVVVASAVPGRAVRRWTWSDPSAWTPQPVVAADRGVAAVHLSWFKQDGTASRTEVRVRSERLGELGAAEPVGDLGGGGLALAVRAGEVHLVVPGRTPPDDEWRLGARVRPPGGRFGALSAIDRDTYGEATQLATGLDGTLHAVWLRHNPYGVRNQLVGAARGSEVWGRHVLIGPARGEIRGLQLATGRGRAAAAWVRLPGDAVQVARWDPSPQAPPPPRPALVDERPDDPPGTTATRFDAAHSGAIAEGPAPPLEPAWSRPMGFPAPQPGRNGPPRSVLVTGGRVHAVETDAEGAAVLRTRRSDTGALAWERPLGGRAQLAAGSGVVVALTSFGAITALDAATGAVRWQQSITTQWRYDSAPTVSGDAVYFTGGGRGGHVWKLDLRTGEQRWRTFLAGNDASSPSVVGGRLHLAFGGPHDLALDTGTGEVLWVGDSCCTGGGGVTPAVVGGRAFGERGSVLDARDGLLLGTYTGDQPPAVAGGVAVFEQAAEDAASIVRAVEVATGRELWRRADGRAIDPPSIIGRHALLWGHDGRLELVDVRTGVRAWSAEIGEAPFSESAVGVGDGHLVLQTTHRLVAFRAAPGAEPPADPSPPPADPPASSQAPAGDPPPPADPPTGSQPPGSGAPAVQPSSGAAAASSGASAPRSAPRPSIACAAPRTRRAVASCRITWPGRRAPLLVRLRRAGRTVADGRGRPGDAVALRPRGRLRPGRHVVEAVVAGRVVARRVLVLQ